MINANGNFQLLKTNYLFQTVAQKTKQYRVEHPDADIVVLGIGDVTRPLVPAVVEAFHKAVDEMAKAETFMGYPENTGYEFLKKAIIENDYAPLGVDLSPEEVFISSGAKSETANFTDMFGKGNTIAITDPVYPVYLDSNIMSGNAGKVSYSGEFGKIRMMDCIEKNSFLPEIPKKRADIIYLCSPNNPTGTAFTRKQLKKWVEYANKNSAIILFDAAYKAYIRDNDIPHSIYEIEGAKTCAVEFCSFSKTAGFTGVRCAYTIVPNEIRCHVKEGGTVSLNKMWNRRHATKFNGVSYITQKAAEACYSTEGKAQIEENINYYLKNAEAIRNCFKELKYTVYGGKNSPYIWLKVPKEYTSWQFFDYLLENYQIVGTPGSGFGKCGEGYFRLTGFGSAENTAKAIARLKAGK
ncbi:MAG: LL-diaminopimelate aminotransferase [Clostridia bacterium]|nr:LL-diaminopimelate aminotransferase [Clostridia bacterium]